jgi:2-polyprenyl-3-methyl-5-hydroxy-6-metoxy-1,4-benzoquinol methylase
MDDFSIGGSELIETLRQLRWINQLLGAAWLTLVGVMGLWYRAGCPVQLSILDVGAGSGDINGPLLRWATRQGIQLQLTLLDLHPDTCALARQCYRSDPRVRVIQGDALHLAVRQVDIVTTSLFMHHFPAARLPSLFKSLLGAARLGVVVNDLHRHPIAWLFISGATRLFSRNRLIRHDAPLSVWRGFRAADFERLKQIPELASLSYVWCPFFRYLVIISTQ